MKNEKTMFWYLEVLRKYATFSGRARRKEFWMFYLFNTLISIILFGVEFSVFGTIVLYYIYNLAVFIPGIAVSVRRLHDTDRSGGWIFIGLIPLFGMIILTVFFCLEGDTCENNYGPNPKEVNA